MSREIDEKVVSMKFDNKHFETNVQTSISTLDKLKASLRLPGATKGLEEVGTAANDIKLSPLGAAAEQVSLKFNALQVMATTALANITNSAVNAGKRIVAAFTIDPIKTGLQEYETQINAVQTIMSNTESKGTTLDDVNKALDDLNTYADKTIYNFTEMTKNIGTFTAAGVDLDTSVNAIQGIANLAAVSGSTSQQASTAMYQLSQALSSGTVKLMDWNSVVNAGMGGQVFQDALKETARVHEIAIDDMIEDQGSFRETLSEGWLTSEILTETLQKFTMATEGLKEEQIEQNRAMWKAKGYTDEQIDGIFKLGQNATDAATKVKTFTQLMDTLKESAQSGWTQTWEILIGDFEEAKGMWTKVYKVFSGIINNMSEARNTLLEGWAKGGGRDSLKASFVNIFEAIKSVVIPIKQAFRDIFPKTTAEQLIKITESIKEFTARLILSEEAQKKLKSAFKGLFAVFNIVGMAIKAVVNGLLELSDSLFDATSGARMGVLGVVASFGEWISGMRDYIEETEIFGKIVGKIVEILQVFMGKIKTVMSFIGNLLGKINLSGVLNGITTVWKGVSFVFGKIWDVICTVGKAMLGAFREGDFKKAFDIFNSGILAGILLGIKKFINGFNGSFDEIKGFVGHITGILDSVKGCFEAYQQSIKADVIMKIAKAIAILATALIVLTFIDPTKLTTSLGIITALFTELMMTMSVFNSMSGKAGAANVGIVKTAFAMKFMSEALLILGVALLIISRVDPKSMGIALLGITGLMVAFSAFINKTKFRKTVVEAGAVMQSFAIAILILAGALRILAGMDIKQMLTGLGSIAGLLTAVSVFITKTKFRKTVNEASKSMIALGIAMLVLASSLRVLAELSITEAAVALGVLAGSLTIVALAMRFIPSNVGKTGKGLLKLCSAIATLAAALTIMGSMTGDQAFKSIFVLAASLAVLVIALNTMKGTTGGSAALLVAAMAIGVLGVSLRILGSMDWSTILKSLATLAGMFIVLGVASALLQPIIPAVMMLSAALLLVGAGVLAAGLGFIALAAGITALSGALTLGAGAITTIVGLIIAGITGLIAGIIGLIPAIIAAIGQGIVLIIQTIANAAGSICNAAVSVITALCNAIIQCIPILVKTAGKLLDALLKFIVKYVPKLVDAGMKCIIGFLDGIAQNIEAVVEKAVLVVTKFIAGIGSQIPKLIDSAFELILDFINGIGAAVEKYTPLIIEACVNLGTSIVKGVLKGLGSMGGAIWDGVCSVGSSIWSGFKDFFGINSPAKKMIPIGGSLDEGIVVGLEKYKRTVVSASEDVGQSAVKSMSNAISGISDVINSDIDSQPTIRPVLDLSNIESGASAINSMFGMTPSVGVLSDVGAINSMMSKNQNGSNSDLMSAIKELGNKISMNTGNTYNINGITYDDGSAVSTAVETLVRAAKIERRI